MLEDVRRVEGNESIFEFKIKIYRGNARCVPCHHGMARPQVAVEETAPRYEE
jgi:hypothetical protein